MNDDVRTTAAKDRSPNFPFIPLDAALDRARQYFAVEKRSAAPFPVVVGHWKMSPSSSSALQTAGALKSYGLMSDEGSGASRKMRLTELALRIILDTRPESRERLEYMRQAARSPAVAAVIYDMYPDGLPSSANLYHHLVLELKFNSTTAHKAEAILRKNHELTNMYESSSSDSESALLTDSAETDAMPAMNAAPTPVAQAVSPRPSPAPQPHAFAVAPISGAFAGEEIANVRVSKSTTIRLIASGPYTRQSIESLVKQLSLSLELGNFDEIGTASDEV